MKKSLVMKVRESLTTHAQMKIEQSLVDFRNAVNDWIRISINNGWITTRTLQKFGYKQLREKYSNLYSAVLLEAMDVAIGILKSAKSKGIVPEFDADVICFKNQHYKLHSSRVIVPLCGEKTYIPLYIPKKFRKYLANYKLGRLTIFKRDDWYYISISVKIEPPERKVTNVIGVDLGVYNFVVVADAKGRELLRISGKDIIERKKLLEYKYSVKQQRARRYSKNRVIGHKYKNYSKYVNHCIAKKVVEIAKKYNAMVVLENLKRIRGKSKSLRRLFRKWPYFDLIQKIEYKAKENGIPVVKINPRNTSKTCSRCGYVDRKLKNERIFVCPKCGLRIDRDLNGAINIARKVVPPPPYLRA
ncbi:MAG: IS200/IS605 family element transposase accessory protein TnpB [Methanococci archaeon]|nr:IS200/IS605 family element transposase accessory protein TnpB [Methanococci archaeon]